MSNITILPSKLNGTVIIPPSKSLSHRAVISASLAHGVSEISNIGYSRDINITIDAMQELGAKIIKLESKLIIDGSNTLKEDREYTVDCGSCGTTLRFLMPLALLSHKQITFTGQGFTPKHFDKYFDIFNKFNVEYICKDNSLPVTIKKGEISGVIELSHTINSQFLSGFLLALPLFKYDCEVRLDAPIDTKSHIDLTLDILSRFGISVHNTNYRCFRIHGNQQYKPYNYAVEGDYSLAAFYLALGAIGSFTICRGLPRSTSQSEKAVFNVIERFGGKVVCENDSIAAIPLSLNGCDINISEVPELLPVVALLGIFAAGETVISGVERSIDFDSDQLTHITDQLNSLGATVVEKPNGLVIYGSPTITGGTADSCNNSKLAIMLAIAGTFAQSEVTIENSDCIKQAYPGFWDDFSILGGRTM